MNYTKRFIRAQRISWVLMLLSLLAWLLSIFSDLIFPSLEYLYIQANSFGLVLLSLALVLICNKRERGIALVTVALLFFSFLEDCIHPLMGIGRTSSLFKPYAWGINDYISIPVSMSIGIAYYLKKKLQPQFSFKAISIIAISSLVIVGRQAILAKSSLLSPVLQQINNSVYIKNQVLDVSNADILFVVSNSLALMLFAFILTQRTLRVAFIVSVAITLIHAMSFFDEFLFNPLKVEIHEGILLVYMTIVSIVLIIILKSDRNKKALNRAKNFLLWFHAGIAIAIIFIIALNYLGVYR